MILRVLALAFIAHFAPAVSADTFTVDDDGPADFSEVSSALASPLVGEGDLLLVEPGNYEAFDIVNRSITILGTGAAPFHVTFHVTPAGGSSATSSISQLTASQRVVLSNIDCISLNVSDSEGSIVAQEVRSGSIDCVNVADFRVEKSKLSASVKLGGDGSSFANFSNCDMTNSSLSFGPALHVEPDSMAIVANCTLVGSQGDQCSGAFCLEAGDGYPAVLSFGTTVLLGSETVLVGGDGGERDQQAFDGEGASAIVVGAGGYVRYSGATLLPGQSHFPPVFAPAIFNAGGTIVTPLLPDPSLTRLGSSVSGDDLQLITHANEGAFVVLFVGTTPQFLPLPGIGGAQLTDFAAFVATKFLVGTDEFVLSAAIPLSLEPGTLLYFQSLVFNPNTTRFTNSIPLVVR